MTTMTMVLTDGAVRVEVPLTGQHTHECEFCGAATELVDELAGDIAYHQNAECVGGVERFAA